MTKKSLEVTIENYIDDLCRQINNINHKDASTRAQLEIAISNCYVALSNLVNKK
jgi:hypothetical protein